MKKSYGAGTVIGGIFIGTLFGIALKILFTNHTCSKTQGTPFTGEDKSVKDIRKKMKKDANEMRSRAEELENLAKD